MADAVVNRPPQFRRRAMFVGLALSTIGVGLAVHIHGTFLPPRARDGLGDALWAMMATWWTAALAPRTRFWIRGAAALALCWAVEVSQLYRAPTLDSWRDTTIGHLVLGSDFDAVDLGMYAIGVIAAILAEHVARHRR